MKSIITPILLVTLIGYSAPVQGITVALLRHHPDVLSVKEERSSTTCNSTLRTGFNSLEDAIGSFDSVVKDCLKNNQTNGSSSGGDDSPFNKLSPACVAGIDSILYELSNSSIAFTKAVQQCAPSGNGSLTPRQERCQNALSNITKYEFLGAVGFPEIVDSCDHSPGGYDCKSGVAALIILAVKLLGLK